MPARGRSSPATLRTTTSGGILSRQTEVQKNNAKFMSIGTSAMEDGIAAVRFLLENNAGQMMGQLAEKTARLQADVLQQVQLVVDRLQGEVTRLQGENERLNAEKAQLRKSSAIRSRASAFPIPSMGLGVGKTRQDKISGTGGSSSGDEIIQDESTTAHWTKPPKNAAVAAAARVQESKPSKVVPTNGDDNARSWSPPAPKNVPLPPAGEACVMDVPGALQDAEDEHPSGCRAPKVEDARGPRLSCSSSTSGGRRLSRTSNGSVCTVQTPPPSDCGDFGVFPAKVRSGRRAQIHMLETDDAYAVRSSYTSLTDDEKQVEKERVFQAINADKNYQAQQKEGGKPKGQAPTAVFADAAAMKDKIRQAVSKKEYRAADYYYDTGFCQFIATHHIFENFTLLIISLNALWIAVETDYNSAALLLNAAPPFIVAENVFCAFFFFEWSVRFGSWRIKSDSLRDAWFVFDSALVLMMIVETWVVTIVFASLGISESSGMGDASVLRLVRLARLTRMARMARLLRAIPELIILIKGIFVAGRSVFFTLVLLLIIMYVFAVIFRQLVDNVTDPMSVPNLKDKYFSSVPHSMGSLLLEGVIPDMVEIVKDCSTQSWILGGLVLSFILLASLTVMNMLVGVLCEVVSVVSSVEKETLTVNYVKAQLMRMFEETGVDADGYISKSEFDRLLVRPDAARIIQEIGVDVVGLVDFSDYVFRDGVPINFADFMELVLQLRGTNNATVKDIVDLRRNVLAELSQLQGKVSTTLQSLEKVSKSILKSSSDREEWKHDDASSHLAVAKYAPPAGGLGNLFLEEMPQLPAAASRATRRRHTGQSEARPTTAMPRAIARGRSCSDLTSPVGEDRPWMGHSGFKKVLLQSLEDESEWDFDFGNDAAAEFAHDLELAAAMSKRKAAWRCEDEV
eukprot:TRINITY_DN29386_c0_g1_i2.p1 TRINITY_DN29386_c0_g1~~TRINITY_DN29386_c0_g1_i2.p1  ORF type:complete len:911 (-),score=190.03 TRINITY_DN29386_c0_g1_i2:76-2808(-)